MRPPTPLLRQTVLLSLLIPALAGCGGGSASAPGTAQVAHGITPGATEAHSSAAPSAGPVAHGITPGATEAHSSAAPSAAPGAQDIKPGVPEPHSSGSAGKLPTNTVSPYMGAYIFDNAILPEHGDDGVSRHLTAMLAIDSNGLIRGFVHVTVEQDESEYLVAGAIKPGALSATLPLSAADGQDHGAVELVFGHNAHEVRAKLTDDSVVAKPVALMSFDPDAPIPGDATLSLQSQLYRIDNREIPSSTDPWALERSTTGASTWTLLGTFQHHSLRATLTPTAHSGSYRAEISVENTQAHTAQQANLQGDCFVGKGANGRVFFTLAAGAKQSFIWVDGRLK